MFKSIRSIRWKAVATAAVALAGALANPAVIAVVPEGAQRAIGAAAIVLLALLKPAVERPGDGA